MGFLDRDQVVARRFSNRRELTPLTRQIQRQGFASRAGLDIQSTDIRPNFPYLASEAKAVKGDQADRNEGSQADHGEGELLERFRTRYVLLASGEGEAEDIGESWRMADVLGGKGIPNRVDSWGGEWRHDWVTWRRMFPQYLAELAPP